MAYGVINIFFKLLRSAVCGERLCGEEREKYSEEMLPELVKMAQAHDIGHLMGVAFEINELPGKEMFEHDVLAAMYRYGRLSFEYAGICDALEEWEIPFLPLKGSVLRAYYREPWLRTSCDIDVLVQSEDLERAVELLVEKRGYQNEGKGPHDISLYSPEGTHVELHYDLVEGERANNASEILKTIWEHTTPTKGNTYWRELDDAMFYYYHIAHMAKHFEEGGCGVRSFIDLWILDNLPQRDVAGRDELIQRGGLLQFAEAARELASIWFDKKNLDEAGNADMMKHFEHYVLYGGMYGSIGNRVVVKQKKKGGRIGYAMSRIFMSHDKLKQSYPVIEKHPILTPIMQIRRWARLLFGGRVAGAVNEMKYNMEISKEEIECVEGLFRDLGL